MADSRLGQGSPEDGFSSGPPTTPPTLDSLTTDFVGAKVVHSTWELQRKGLTGRTSSRSYRRWLEREVRKQMKRP